MKSISTPPTAGSNETNLGEMNMKRGKPIVRRGKRNAPAQGTVDGVVDDAYSEIESLSEEMRSWAENMEENFSATEKYSMVVECADLLEAVERPTTPENLLEERVDFTQDTRRNLSRSSRLNNCVVALEAVCELVEEKIVTLGDDDEVSEWDEFFTSLRQTIEEVEQAEFPGMFG